MPDSDFVENHKSNSKIPFSAILTISICWILALANQAYFQGVFEVSEAREGVVVQEIKEFGTWILPLRNGEIIPSKPPLFHWATALLSIEKDHLNDFYLRAVSLICSILSLLALYLFLKSDLKNNESYSQVPLLSTLAYATTYGFIQMAIDGRVDMTFNLFFVLSILYLNHFLLNNKLPNIKHKILLSFIIGLGILSRGPLSIVLFYLALGSGLLSIGRIKDLKKWLIDDYFVVIIGPLLISGPWYLASKFLGKPELINRQLVFENINRFFGSDKIPTKPFWFYLEHIWMQTFPWGFVLVGLVAYLIWSKKPFYSDDKMKHYLKLYASQALIIFIFFSISSGKRKAYLLSVLPFLAVIIGILYFRVLEVSNLNKLRSNKIEKFSFFLALLTIIAILLKCILFYGVPSFIDYSFFQGLYYLPLKSLFLPILITLCLYLVLRKHKQNPHWVIIVISCLALQSYISIPAFFYLTKGESHSYKYFVSDIENRLNPQEELKVIKSKEDESLDSFLFYFGKRIPIILPNEIINPGIYLAKKSWVDDQPIEVKSRMVIRTQGKRLADKNKRNLVLFELK